jgi:hypothetical protein
MRRSVAKAAVLAMAVGLIALAAPATAADPVAKAGVYDGVDHPGVELIVKDFGGVLVVDKVDGIVSACHDTSLHWTGAEPIPASGMVHITHRDSATTWDIELRFETPEQARPRVHFGVRMRWGPCVGDTAYFARWSPFAGKHRPPSR